MLEGAQEGKEKEDGGTHVAGFDDGGPDSCFCKVMGMEVGEYQGLVLPAFFWGGSKLLVCFRFLGRTAIVMLFKLFFFCGMPAVLYSELRFPV